MKYRRETNYTNEYTAVTYTKKNTVQFERETVINTITCYVQETQGNAIKTIQLNKNRRSPRGPFMGLYLFVTIPEFDCPYNKYAIGCLIMESVTRKFFSNTLKPVR